MTVDQIRMSIRTPTASRFMRLSNQKGVGLSSEATEKIWLDRAYLRAAIDMLVWAIKKPGARETLKGYALFD